MGCTLQLQWCSPQQSHGCAFVAAISGSSRSGKTTLASLLASRLQDDGLNVVVVPQDNYMKASCDDAIFWQGRQRKTWECPQFTAWPKLHEAVSMAREHCDVVIVEGCTRCSTASRCSQACTRSSMAYCVGGVHQGPGHPAAHWVPDREQIWRSRLAERCGVRRALCVAKALRLRAARPGARRAAKR